MSDPNFRGVVLGSSWRLGYRFSTIGANGELTPQPRRNTYVGQPWAIDPLIRRSLFYFDRISWPTNNVFPQGDVLGREFLIGEGELEQLHIEIQLDIDDLEMVRHMASLQMGLAGDPARTAEQVAQFHRDIFLKHERQQPGAWNFATVGEGIEFSADESVRGYSMQMYNCLPAPAGTVPYEYIIDFKKRERSALLDLRAHLDQAYMRIAGCGDAPFAANLEITKLQKSIDEVTDLLVRANLPFYLQSLEVDLSPIQWVAAAMAGADASERLEKFGLRSPLPQMAGSIFAAALLIKRKDIQSPIRTGGVFKYIYTAGENGIIDAEHH